MPGLDADDFARNATRAGRRDPSSTEFARAGASRHAALALAVALTLAHAPLDAAGAPASPDGPVPSRVAGTLPPVEVTAPLPLPGLELPANALPVLIQQTDRDALDAAGLRTAADVLEDGFTGVHVASAQGSPFQPDVSFRGLGVSPILGSQNSLVVLLDGVRLNESFGDVVLWDLVPTPAIARLDLVPAGAPPFGPNALGGTLRLTTRSGRDLQGVEAEVGASAFRGRQASVAAGGAVGAFDGFVAAAGANDGGWRDRSPARVRQFYAKGGWQSDDTRVTLAYTRAENRLVGNALVPEPFLEERREAVYTYPDESRPGLDFWQSTLRRTFDGGLVLTGHAYFRRLDLATTSGDAEYDDEGTPLLPDDDEYEAELRAGRTRQRGAGAGLQAAWDGMLGSLRHRLAAGLVYDDGHTRYTTQSSPAEFTPDRGVIVDGDPEPDTDVATKARYAGLYASDTISLTDAASLTLATRYDRARVDIRDRSGLEPKLNGSHTFSRVSPSAGLAWTLAPSTSLHLAYSQGFRVPTPAELTCASPDDPCALPVAFVADPPLKPVVGRTWEASARTRALGVEWRAVAYRTALRNDILFTGVGAGRGFFSNVPSTRRQGVELDSSGGRGAFGWRAQYAFVDATYRAPVALFNPVAVAADPSTPATIDVRAGNRIPGVPRHLVRLHASWSTPRTTLAASFAWTSRQFLRGDDANVNAPLQGYGVTAVRLERRLTRRLVAEFAVDNVFDERYATIGALNRSAFGADGEPFEGGPGAVERFVSPGAPRAWTLALRYRLGDGT